MATKDMFQTSDLVPQLAERGITLSREQVFRLVAQPPQRLSMDTIPRCVTWRASNMPLSVRLSQPLACHRHVRQFSFLRPLAGVRWPSGRPDRDGLCGRGGMACAIAFGVGNDPAGVDPNRGFGGVADRGHSRGCGEDTGFVVNDLKAGPG